MKNPPCPQCKSNKNVLEICYGLPGPEMEKMSMKGKIILGGCTITPESPQYHCTKCEADFGTVDWTDDYWEFLAKS